eukprot:Skav209005  [mRNA]  locus=scaffold2686:287459:290281:- [translate_table: standard]
MQRFERELVSILQRSSSGLADAEVLGSLPVPIWQSGEGQQWRTTAATSSSAARPISIKPSPPSVQPLEIGGRVMSADDFLPGQIADEPRTTEEVLANITVDKLDDNVKKWLNDQNTQTLNGALAFVPFILQQAYYEGNLDEEQIVIHKGSGGHQNGI